LASSLYNRIQERVGYSGNRIVGFLPERFFQKVA
jgi:hypothetical protein